MLQTMQYDPSMKYSIDSNQISILNSKVQRRQTLRTPSHQLSNGYWFDNDDDRLMTTSPGGWKGRPDKKKRHQHISRENYQRERTSLLKMSLSSSFPLLFLRVEWKARTLIWGVVSVGFLFGWNDAVRNLDGMRGELHWKFDNVEDH